MADPSITTEEHTRTEYLVDYRSDLWTQIRAKEDNIWRFISFYAGAIILAVGFIDPAGAGSGVTPVTAMLLILAVILVSFWGILITLDSNFWMQNNFIIIRNIEKSIFTRNDIGVTIPADFVSRSHYRYSTSYFIQLIFFSFIMGLAVVAFIATAVSQAHSASGFLLAAAQVVSLVFCLLLLYTLNRNQKWVRRIGKLQLDAPGFSVGPEKPFTPALNLVGSYCDANLEDIFLLFSTLAPFGFIFSTLSLQSFYPFPPQVSIVVILAGLLVTAAGFTFRILTNIKYRGLCRRITTITTLEELNGDEDYLSLASAVKGFQVVQKWLIVLCVLVNLWFLGLGLFSGVPGSLS